MLSYNPVIITVLMAVHTYTGPILISTYLCDILPNINNFLKVQFMTMIFEMIVFCFVSTVMRYHLFVWTVFSPKLLYLGMNLVVTAVLSTLIILCKSE